jgi:tripartite-type tricarboxylate transporter receptor subunit TctC
MPAVRDKLSALGADPMPLSPAAFDDYVRQEIDANAVLVKAAGIKAN